MTGLLARLDTRVQQRLDRGGMRMEDADPVSMGVARVTRAVLNRVDRVTGFRERHRAGERMPR